MANGKGTTDCSYCVHYCIDKDERESCDFWKVGIPRTPDHRRRFCTDYSPGEFFFRHTGYDQATWRERSMMEECASIGIDVQPGVLYGYFYNSLSTIIEIMRLGTESPSA